MVPGPKLDLSIVRATGLPAPGLDPRKVLLTATGLKLAGLLTVAEVRLIYLSFGPTPSTFAASESDPPLRLTSAEFGTSSRLASRLLSISLVILV